MGVEMKKLFGCLLFLLLYLLLFPLRALSDARAGLLLWYHSVLPVLFPFMLICGILIRFDLLDRILHVVSRPFHTLFGCSQYGAFAILVGFLCGFPMGAKITRDLREQEKISAQEASVLYGFVNNLSPSFLLSYLAADQLKLPSLGILFLLNVLGSAFLYGIISARFLRRAHLPHAAAANRPALKPDLQTTFQMIDDCVYDAIRNAVRLGAYIVMFSLLSGAVTLLFPAGNPVVLFLSACVEVSSGVHMIAASPLPLEARYLLITVIAAFGGLSALAQSASVASMDRRLLADYIKSRVKITLLSAFMALISVLLFRLRLL